MDVLWDTTPSHSGGLTVREVTEALSGRAPAYTTVMTVLDRLPGNGTAAPGATGRQPAATRTSPN